MILAKYIILQSSRVLFYQGNNILNLSTLFTVCTLYNEENRKIYRFKGCIYVAKYQQEPLFICVHCTVGEHIIGVPKIRNNYGAI